MSMVNNMKDIQIGIIGLGYVGLPLAIAFGQKFPTVGYDLNQERISQLIRGVDLTNEVEKVDFAKAKKLSFSAKTGPLKSCNVFIITVPTPVNENLQPDLSYLISASTLVGQVLKPGDTVIYESTVYPGATEDDCVPILEECSKLIFNEQFFVGYSPERINPGDKSRRLESIVKITSGSTDEAAEFVDQLYSEIISAGTYRAKSIKVAEAAKVIENTQRDLNIALVNELAIVFDKLQIDTEEVLNAAESKWNFLSFRPGLVGGHCIGVDPYYLTFKSQSVGYIPDVILAGRRINSSMGRFVADKFIRKMIEKRIQINGSRVLILGLSFKENCPDLRNTKVLDLINILEDYGIEIDVYDPVVSIQEAKEKCDVLMVEVLKEATYDGVIIAVGHDEFKKFDPSFYSKLSKQQYVLFDLKYILDKGCSNLRL